MCPHTAFSKQLLNDFKEIFGNHNCRKCNLLDAISVEEVESKYIEIYKYFTVAEYIPYVSGLTSCVQSELSNHKLLFLFSNLTFHV